MRTIVLLAAALVALSSSACSRSARAPEDASKETWAAYARKTKAAAETAVDSNGAKDVSGRQVGDFVVRRFSGTFAKSPITLTERVIARDAAALIVDVTVDDGKKKQTMRLRLNDTAAARGEIIEVARMDGDTAVPADVAAYEAMMQRVTLAADQNEEMLSETDTTLDVSGTSLPCRERTFRVRMGKKSAIMRTVESEKFAWGDVAAEITALDGKVLYRAEVVESGRVEPRAAAPVTASVDEE